MSNSTLDQDIQVRIQSFLDELSGLVRKSALEAVQIALSGDGSAPKRRGRGRPRGSGKRGPGRPRKAAAKMGKRIRRSAEDLEAIAGRVLAHVKANAGHRLEEIGRALKTDTSILKRPIANLLAAKKLRTQGQKRGTKYFTGGGRSGARKAKASKGRNPAKRTGRKAKRARRGSSKRAMRRTAKAKPAATPTAAAA